MELELKVGIIGLGVMDSQLGNRVVEEICSQNLQNSTISKLFLNRDTRNPIKNDFETVNKYINDFQIKLKRFRDLDKVAYGSLEQIADECDIILMTYGAGISDTNPKTRRAMEFNNNVRTLKRICRIIESVFDSSKGYLHIVSNPTDYLVHFAREFLPNADFNQIGGHNHVDTFRARAEFEIGLGKRELSEKLNERVINIGEHSRKSFLHLNGLSVEEQCYYKKILQFVYEKMLKKGFDYLDFMGTSNLDTAKTVIDLIKGINTEELFGISGEFEYEGKKICIGLPRKLVMRNGIIRWENDKAEIERIKEIHAEKLENIAENFKRRIDNTGKIYDYAEGKESADLNYRWEEVKKVFVLNTFSEFCVIKSRVEDERIEEEGLETNIKEIKKINGKIVIFKGNDSKLSVITQIWKNKGGVYELNNHLHQFIFIPNSRATHSSLNLGINEDIDLMTSTKRVSDRFSNGLLARFSDRLYLAKLGLNKVWMYDTEKSSEIMERCLDCAVYSMFAYKEKLFIGSESEILVLGHNFEILRKIPVGNFKVTSLKFLESAETNPVIVFKLENVVESFLSIYDWNNQTNVCHSFDAGKHFDARHIFHNGHFNLDIFYEKDSKIKQRRFVFNQGLENCCGEFVPADSYPITHNFVSRLQIDDLKVDGRHIYVVSRNKLLKFYELRNEFKETIIKQLNDNIMGFAICEVIE